MSFRFLPRKTIFTDRAGGGIYSSDKGATDPYDINSYRRRRLLTSLKGSGAITRKIQEETKKIDAGGLEGEGLTYEKLYSIESARRLILTECLKYGNSTYNCMAATKLYE